MMLLAACGDSSIDEETEQNEQQQAEAGGECDELNMAVNPWVGYEASAYVVGTVAQEELGCTVNYKNLKEDVSWQGFASGEVDVVIEDWGHPDLEEKFFEESGDGSAMDFGPNGNVGIIGWYVPPWLAAEHPDILEWENLNEYADEFATSESGDKGQFLGADPSYVQFDEAIISNLDLDFEVVFSGSEAAEHRGVPERREEQGVPDRLLLRAAVAVRRAAAGEGRAPAVRGGLPGRPGRGGLRLPRRRC
jgi:glycine betaine/proline transport system substrate-binding protein